MAIANNQIETNENKNKEKEVKQYIVVQIGSEKYGIDISYVDNIVRMKKITVCQRHRSISRESSIFEAKLCRL